MIDDQRCAALLYAATWGFKDVPGKAGGLAGLRAELARLFFALDPAELPAATPDPTIAQTPDWLACCAAVDSARNGNGALQPPKGPYAVLWPADRADIPSALPAPEPKLPLPWAYSPQANAQIKARIGPVIDRDGREATLFVFEVIDRSVGLRAMADMRPGLYPRPETEAPARPRAVARGSGVLAFIAIALSLFLGLYANTSVYVLSGFAHGAVAEMRKGVTLDGARCVENGRLAWPEDETAAKCEQAWRTAWNMQKPPPRVRLTDRHVQDEESPEKIAASPLRETGWIGVWRSIQRWFWRPLGSRDHLSLLAPFLQGGIAVLLLVIGAGLFAKGYVGGALIDERNRLSLARLQQISWTVLIFAAYVTLSLFNVALMAPAMREAVQAATGDTSAIASLLPSMDPTLWAVLGITAVVSPFLSKRILGSKDAPEGEAFQSAGVVSGPLAPPDPISKRRDSTLSRWSDLFMGESIANKNTLDLSRLQHLIITFLLLATYLFLLLDYLRDIGGKAILSAALTGTPVFAAMPPVDATFVGLLTLSHAGYLVFKALPKEPTSAGAR